MTDSHLQLLMDHLDDSLRGKGSPEMEQSINNDPETAQEWLYMKLAMDAVQDAGLHEQVTAVKSDWLAQQSAEAGDKLAEVRSIFGKAMRVAACLLLLAGGVAVFKYTTTSSAGLYAKYYTSYVLNASRGNGTPDALEDAYNNKNWAAVIAIFNGEKTKNNKSLFLTGMADLSLKKYEDAIDKFQQVIAANAQSGGDYFQDEAEFYLAMSWLAGNEVTKALPLFEKIRATKSHLYHEKVAKMSFTDLHIAQYKSHK